MREAFVHELRLRLDPGVELGAPGAAITTALCGHWEHEPPCPLAPHHSRAVRIEGDDHVVLIRTLFVAEPSAAPQVRQRIEEAGQRREFTGPNGVTTRWVLLRSAPGSVTPAEAEHGARLARTPSG